MRFINSSSDRVAMMHRNEYVNFNKIYYVKHGDQAIGH